MRLSVIVLVLLLAIPTTLVAASAQHISLTSQGVLGDHVFRLVLNAPFTSTRSGVQSSVAGVISSDVVEALYVVDGVGTTIPVVLSGSHHGPDITTGTLLLDVTGQGEASGFRTAVRMGGAAGSFAGSGTLAHRTDVGTVAALARLS